MNTQLSIAPFWMSSSNTQCPAVATRLWYLDWMEDAEHQYSLSPTVKNTLPMVLGRLTFLTLVGTTFSWPIGAMAPPLPSGAASPPPSLILPSVWVLDSNWAAALRAAPPLEVQKSATFCASVAEARVTVFLAGAVAALAE